MSLYNLVHQYPISRTLRFELKPYNKKVSDNIKHYGIIEQDHKLAKNYQEAKVIIDDYHRDYIEERLAQLILTDEELALLEQFETLQNKKNRDEKEREELITLQDTLRKKIASHLKDDERYSRIDKVGLIREDLPAWLAAQKESATPEEKKALSEAEAVVKSFYYFSTYFQGFFENRRNVYTDKAHSTGIAYRIIHDNLPRFCENREAIRYIKTHHPTLFTILEKTVETLYQEEIITIDSIEELFSLGALPLSQTEIKAFNRALGGDLKQGKKIQGLNEKVNLYRQQVAREDRNQSRQIPYFTRLYRQILSDYDPLIFETIENDEELIAELNDSALQLIDHIPTQLEGETTTLTTALSSLKEALENADIDTLWLRNNRAITDLSHTLFGDFGLIHTALEHYYKETYEGYRKENPTQTMERQKEAWLKSPHFALGFLEKALLFYRQSLDGDDPLKGKITEHCLLNFFVAGLKREHSLLTTLTEKREALKQLIARVTTKWAAGELYNLRQSAKDIALIKEYLDAVMAIFHHLRNLMVETVDEAGISYERDSFYTFFDTIYHHLDKIIPLYNRVRNYVTKKPYSKEKFKLNFENSQLADGWDANKEKDYTTILLRKTHYRVDQAGEAIENKPYYCYYLAIMRNETKAKRVFEEFPTPEAGEDHFEKMYYKLLPNPHMQMPRIFFSKKGRERFQPSAEIDRIYKEKTFQLGKNFNQDDLHKLIDFYKIKLKEHPDWNEFNHTFSATKTFNNIGEFFTEVGNQGYLVRFDPIPTEYIEALIEKGEIHLFQLHNKDFSPHSHGMPNMHTLYWNALFSEENLKNTIYKLDGGAELFYRPASIERKITHAKGEELTPKTDTAHHRARTLDFDLIKDRRFTEDKFQFHVPITLNYQASGSGYINDAVNHLIQEKGETFDIMGIDRGERNLLYLSIINPHGKIIHQQDLNVMNGINYQERLEEAEKERQHARQNWQSIEGIRNLKAGYLSFAVHEIARLLVKHNALLVMEDLNFGFKRGRMKFERQIYQNFEKAIIDKLNYLLFKDADEKNGLPGVRHALQLTNKFESFQRLGKQSGIIFYVPANYTSRIDPTTGFVDLFGQKLRYQSIAQAKQFLSLFKMICYNPNRDHFEFTFRYADFGGRGKELTREWQLIGDNQERFVYNRLKEIGEKAHFHERNERHLVANELKNLFDKTGISYQQGDNLIDKILTIDHAPFFRQLLFNIQVLTALRYYDNQGNDYILSPISNHKGTHFDSRKEEKAVNHPLPHDSDGNGAYHIAHKGKMLVDKIIAHNLEGSRPDLKISNFEWFTYMQEK